MTDDEYRTLAKTHGLPDKLVDSVLRESEGMAYKLDFWSKTAKRTSPKFWAEAVKACQNKYGWVGCLSELHWAVGDDGSDVYDQYTTAEQKRSKRQTLKMIRDLKRKLAGQRLGDIHQKESRFVGDELGLMTLVGYSYNAKVSSLGGVILDNFKAGSPLINPTVGELLDCLASAVEQDFESSGVETMPDPKKRPKFEPEKKGDVVIRFHMQKLIEWFYAQDSDAPEIEIIKITTGTRTPNDYDSAYVAARKLARKNIPRKLPEKNAPK